MHPTYAIYTSLGSKVSGWKSSVYTVVDKTFSTQKKVRDQVTGNMMNAERVAEEGRRRREQESSDAMFEFYGTRPPPGKYLESS